MDCHIKKMYGKSMLTPQDLQNISAIVQVQVKEQLKIELKSFEKKMNKRFNSIEKASVKDKANLEMMIDFFDKRQIKILNRLELIEYHLGTHTLPQVMMLRDNPSKT